MPMKSNEVLDKLPRHLLKLVIDQPYNDYTAQDHAVWRYVMRRNVQYLSRVAHGSYLDGLKKTGISIDSIPHMYGMNRILKEIGWAAVAVDGFIPPSAFMEFQAHNVLVIAADIRPVSQIEYTPAPDIIHEAAGHAPIIADPEYAAYLRFFGEIGVKAFSSANDYKLYEAIRHLSILKADPYTPMTDIENAEWQIKQIESAIGPASEMALIRNLHWWTVEYGLIGNIKDYKIYGAGLLSSIGESMNCMKPEVKKIPYSIDAVNYSFDITTQQPQLFVTPDFKHLNSVLNEFANTMALRKGGALAVKRAEDSGSTATVVLDSGIQICGTFDDCIYADGEVIYVKTNSSTSLCVDNHELMFHGRKYHPQGFGSPLGNLVAGGYSFSKMTQGELDDAGFQPGVRQELLYESGITLQGIFERATFYKGKLILLSFSSCLVQYKGQILFKPAWGNYDMAIGEEVISAFQGPADADAFDLEFQSPAEQTHKIIHNSQSRRLHQLYQQIRNARSGEGSMFQPADLLNEITTEYPDEWLLLLELYEFLESAQADKSVLALVEQRLHQIKIKNPAFKRLIDDGMKKLEVLK
ncbi:MAG: aromatic amino acid hydroxylase [Lentimicrobiaceae bacterium]|nr:aromatic amino acid hydroxylase [Lentimicrobiaceae bacterium]